MSYNQATFLSGYSGTTSAAPGSSGTNAILTSETPLASLSNPKKRKPTKTKPSKQLARSVSTPQLFGLSTMSDTDDKKRNKLGYQRISIACVDQQSAIEGKSDCRTKPDNGSAPSSVVSSASPKSGTERAFEDPRKVRPFPSLPSNAPSDFQQFPIDPGNAMTGQAAHPSFTHHHFGYGGPDQAHPSWGTPDTFNHEEPMMPAPVGNMPKYLWHYGQQGPTGDYAPFPVNVPPVSQSPQAMSPFAFNEPRSDSVWAPQQSPLRSASYGNVDHLQPNDPSFTSAYSAPPPSMRYPPPPLEFSNPTMMLQEPAPFSTPVGPPTQSIPTPHPYAFHQGPPDHNATIPTHQTYPGNWMAMPHRFGPTQEEPGGEPNGSCDHSMLAEAIVYRDDKAIGRDEDIKIGWFGRAKVYDALATQSGNAFPEEQSAGMLIQCVNVMH
ncbi:hypothetical protein KC340_g16924 [Hortaea werneckii]|nr:hypothetical protein KC342_g17239 [Hortaea werneckii]KAI7066843.1 hypothetical protein KC339_g15426 [Hortaea werneckii]KAI7208518.1 hypothetical protein KC365_g16044 [Hortaea werneckii]KAI7291869.1 hypothetical protein KC340_g16924 [Hortaea werneckii]